MSSLVQDNNFQAKIGLPGSGFIEIHMFCLNLFQLSPEERCLVYTIVDAVSEFERYCKEKQIKPECR